MSYYPGAPYDPFAPYIPNTYYPDPNSSHTPGDSSTTSHPDLHLPWGLENPLGHDTPRGSTVLSIEEDTTNEAPEEHKQIYPSVGYTPANAPANGQSAESLQRKCPEDAGLERRKKRAARKRARRRAKRQTVDGASECSSSMCRSNAGPRRTNDSQQSRADGPPSAGIINSLGTHPQTDTAGTIISPGFQTQFAASSSDTGKNPANCVQALGQACRHSHLLSIAPNGPCATCPGNIWVCDSCKWWYCDLCGWAGDPNRTHNIGGDPSPNPRPATMAPPVPLYTFRIEAVTYGLEMARDLLSRLPGFEEGFVKGSR